MITLKEFFEVIDFKVTDGQKYQWNSFGPNAYAIDYWDGDQDGASLTVIFDTVNQTVYSAQACDCKNGRAYRLMNPDYTDAYTEECVKREVEDVAWDDVPWIDLDVDEDWLEKARSIFLREDYDTKIQVPLDLSKDELYQLMMLAHKEDLTLNQLVEQILLTEINKRENHSVKDQW